MVVRIGIFVQLAKHDYYRYIRVYVATVYKVFGIVNKPVVYPSITP